MSSSTFKRAEINTKEPSKQDQGDEWEVTFPIVVEPSDSNVPYELAERINDEWEREQRRAGNRIGGSLCSGRIEGNTIIFSVPKSEVKTLESSVKKMSLMLVTEQSKYLSKAKREASSESDLDEVLGRIRNKV